MKSENIVGKGLALKQAIDNCGMKQAAFAKEMGTNPQNITNWIKRAGVPPRLAFKAAKTLGVPASSISEIQLSDTQDLAERKVISTRNEIRDMLLTCNDTDTLEKIKGIVQLMLK